jgi:hypothetical protein
LDEDVAADIAVHLQGIGQYIRALDIIQYTAIPEVRKCLGIKKNCITNNCMTLDENDGLPMD